MSLESTPPTRAYFTDEVQSNTELHQSLSPDSGSTDDDDERSYRWLKPFEEKYKALINNIAAFRGMLPDHRWEDGPGMVKTAKLTVDEFLSLSVRCCKPVQQRKMSSDFDIFLSDVSSPLWKVDSLNTDIYRS